MLEQRDERDMHAQALAEAREQWGDRVVRVYRSTMGNWVAQDKDNYPFATFGIGEYWRDDDGASSFGLER